MSAYINLAEFKGAWGQRRQVAAFESADKSAHSKAVNASRDTQMPAQEYSEPPRWPRLIACMIAMMAIANLQYAWTLFTTDLTKSFHARLDQVQLTLAFFVIAQTALFPISAYLVDRFGPRRIVTLASLLVAMGWIGAGRVNSLLLSMWCTPSAALGPAPSI